MQKIKEFIPILLAMSILIVSIIMFVRNNNQETENHQSKEHNKNVMNTVNDEIYNRLLNESKDDNAIKTVIDYIGSGKYYHIQEEIEYNDKIYRSVQLSNLDYPNRDYPEFQYNHEEHDIFYIYNSKESELKSRLDQQLEEKNIVEYRTEEYDDFFGIIKYHCPSVMATNIGDEIVLYRDKEFGFMKEIAVTALLCYNKDGEIEDVKVFQGAVGLRAFVDEYNELVWQVYYAEQENYYWIGLRYPKHEDYLNGWDYSSGSVYNIHLNDEGQIYAIELLYESKDNLWEDIFVNEDSYFGGKKYVKNYNLSILDIINYPKIIEKLETINLLKKEEHAIIKDMFGKETIKVIGDVTQSINYVTKEGYIVRFKPYVEASGNERKTQITYVKLTAEEYMDMNSGEKEKYLNNNEKLLFVDGEINPELLKELEEK